MIHIKAFRILPFPAVISCLVEFEFESSQHHAASPCSSKSTMQTPCTAQLAGHPPMQSDPARLRGT